MGASASSTGGASSEVVSHEQREEESLASSSLPMLQNAFSKLSLQDSHAIPRSSLEEVFHLQFINLQSKSFQVPEYFSQLLDNLSPAIVDLLFKPDEKGISWIGFLRGFNRCTGRMPTSTLLNILFILYSASSIKANNPIEMDFDPDDIDGKVTGSFSLNNVLMFLWMCFVIEGASRIPISLNDAVGLPDTDHLIMSASMFCNEVADYSDFENVNISDLSIKIPLQKFHSWILRTVPGLGHCISKFVQFRLEVCTTSQDELEKSTSSFGDDTSKEVNGKCLLTCGGAWAISYASRSFTNELLESCFPKKDSEALDNLLYRSSIHGKGLSRLWFHLEGYHGPLLILLAGSSVNSSRGDIKYKDWVIGILTGQGLENHDTFHGSSGYLFAVNPIFRAYPALGKEKNYVYFHLRPAKRVYDPHPKPVGVAFGGTHGNERIFIDEDFANVTIRHHAVDKTYHPGSLIPNQGFLPATASVLEVEVWGLGGKSTKQQQDAYKKRESLFSEQRRKIDMKTFASWEDSPEKMMMDMVSDPNKVRREDR